MKEKKVNSFDELENEVIEGNEQELSTIEQSTIANLGFAKGSFSIVDKFFSSFFGLIISIFGGKQ